MLPLALMSEGEVAEIVALGAGAVASSAARVAQLGLRVGKRVVMLNNGAGPVLVKVDGSRIAVDRGIALRIKVRRT